jgi:hypothetical protein
LRKVTDTIGIRILHKGPTKALFETRETMRLITAGALTSFHSGRVLVSTIKHREKRTVSLECQLVCESKLNLLLHIAQYVGQIANKLVTIKGTRFSVNRISLLIREWY